MLKKFLARLRSKWSIFVALGIIMGFLGGLEMGKNTKVVFIHADSVVHLTDTLRLKEVKYVHMPAKIDTVSFVVHVTDTLTNTVRDTLLVTEVASLDTLLAEGRLNLKYYTVPRVFDFAWQPLPIEVRCRQLFGGHLGLEERRLVQFTAGASLGETWSGKPRAGALFAGHLGRNVVYSVVDTQGYSLGVGRTF